MKIRILNEIIKITEKQNYSIDIEASGKNKIKLRRNLNR